MLRSLSSRLVISRILFIGELLGLVAFHPGGGYPAAVRVALALIAAQV
jgi:hypothetical protein